jgi:hypothetical protein
MQAKRPKDQRRADYFLYTWQIHAIRRLAAETQKPPSAVVRDLLNQALAEDGLMPPQQKALTS